MVEMNLHFSSRKASNAPCYIHCMCVVNPLNDNSIIENRLKRSTVNDRKSLTFIENECTNCVMRLVFIGKRAHRTGNI